MKILILHASAGTGHQRAAEALRKAFLLEQPGSEVNVEDLLDFTPAIYRRTYAKGYLTLVRRAPELWGYMYALTDRTALVPWRTRLRTLFNRINAAEFLLYLRRFRPDVAVCTHFLPLEVMAGLTRRPPGRHLYCAVTDFAAHSLWMVRRVARYYVATEEARRQLIRRGQPEQGVRVLGIPVDPAFAGRADAHRVRSRLGLRPDLFTVLMVSGGFGMGAVHELLRVFQNSHLRCQFIVVAGTNEKLRRRVTAVSRDMGQPVAVLGFVDCMHELMDASDLVVTKPGGLSTAEALAKGLPMLLTDPIPGQEQRNCEHLLENGAAQRLFEVADAPHRVRQFIENPGLLDGMRSRSRALGRPDAARNIARDILSTVSG